MTRGQPGDANWRLLELYNPSRAMDLRRVVVLEQVDSGRSAALRIWCQGLIDEEEWTQVEVVRVDSKMCIQLPPEIYYGLPARMFIDCPNQQSVGSSWPLRTEDARTVIAPLVLKRVLSQSRADIERIEQFYRSGTAPRAVEPPVNRRRHGAR